MNEWGGALKIVEEEESLKSTLKVEASIESVVGEGENILRPAKFNSKTPKIIY